MPYLKTWNLCMHSPSIITMLYSMGLSIHMHGECIGREQSRMSILIQLIQWSHILFVFTSPTCICFPCFLFSEASGAGARQRGWPRSDETVLRLLCPR